MRRFLVASLSVLSIALSALPRPIYAEMASSSRKMTGSAAGLPLIDISSLKGTSMRTIKDGEVAGESFMQEDLWKNDDETLLVFVVRRPG